MIRTAPRHRVPLRLDCLEDRFAPATLLGFGQATIALTSAQFAEAPAIRFEIIVPPTTAVAATPPPIGFFHVFAQNGFCSGEFIEKAPLPPRPRPVTPPPLPGAQQQPERREIQQLDAQAVAVPEPPQANAAQTVPVDIVPPLAPVPARAPVQPQRTPESIKPLETTNETPTTVPAPESSNFGIAAITGLFAANYLASRQPKQEKAAVDSWQLEVAS